MDERGEKTGGRLCGRGAGGPDRRSHEWPRRRWWGRAGDRLTTCRGFALAESPGGHRRVLIVMLSLSAALTTLLGCLAAWPSAVASPTVKIMQGELRGEMLTSVQGKNYVSFKGIPYAAAPIGALRFKPPQPPASWEGVRDALKEGFHCHQAEGAYFNNDADEDCLFLNVYTPELPSGQSSTRPVMVWFHDGGFTEGSGDGKIYGPDYLVDAGVLLVTINYRLNILGFLSLDNEEVPGNMGLKDQVAALKWVRDNIAAFGGDPASVTIFGESAGGASVQFHLLSPLSKGLFHKAISQSGSPLNPWAMSASNKERAFQVGEKMGCGTNDTDELLECLRRADAANLVTAAISLFPSDENIMCLKYPFSPTVEPESEGSFISEHPSSALKAGRFNRVPYVIGTTAYEGSLGVIGANSSSGWSALNTKFERQLPEIPIPVDKFITKVREFYFNNEILSEKNIDKYIEFYTDFWFANGVYESTKQIAAVSHQPTFFYVFYFDGALGLLKRIADMPKLKGPGHIDELGYIFNSDVNKPNVTADSLEMVTLRRMIKLWTNFAKTGHPTPSLDGDVPVAWKPVGNRRTCFYSIDSQLSMECHLNKDRINFWEKLYQETP